MYKLMKTFICRSCVNLVTESSNQFRMHKCRYWCQSNLELVDKFHYLGDMLSVDRDADVAVETRIGLNRFRQLVPLLTNKDISLIVRGRLNCSCVRSCMLHGSVTWPIRKENEVALHTSACSFTPHVHLTILISSR